MSPTTVDTDRYAAFIGKAGFGAWRERVASAKGCAHPIHLAGRTVLHDKTADGRPVLRTLTAGTLMVPCGTRRAAICPACADRYAADAFHLIRAGLAGGEKDVPLTVRDTPRLFVTVTAPSFGKVHSGGLTARGNRKPCGCGAWHHPDDPILSTPIDPDTYDYVGAVLWHAMAGALWHKFTERVARIMAARQGIKVSEFREHARVSYAKVAEYQARGMVHFHVVIRVDGPTGPDSPRPAWVTASLLEDCVRLAAAEAGVSIDRPSGAEMTVQFGPQVDVRPITARLAGQFEDADGTVSEAAIAGYIAKYATKSTGTTAGGDRRFRSQLDIDNLTGISEHHRRMIQMAWNLGGLPQYADLKLRRWAHMLGFRGHFLTKSRKYSTTFKRIRGDQADYQRAQTLARLGVDDPDTVLVVNDWRFTAVGHVSPVAAELAAAFWERTKAERAMRRADQYETEHDEHEGM
ncbi:replication initiator [Kutzneria kofuensis]|uniref:Replication initiation protein n=1 Tax=Kutzneria kofuensis TaxID=103725 RepID=A0A7W9NF38_9PSEU|nr:replication initiator [Kutzneria kofuensis]MBB5891007.1 hypothetical protein [Kutzneria kofuensis]